MDGVTARSPAKILIVDDLANNRAALARILEDVQTELMTVASGNEALAMCTRHDFALILLDVTMPVMDGFEVASLLRIRAKTRHVPILFITGQVVQLDQFMKGYATGAVDFIQKPIDNQILIMKVKVFLELYHHQRDQEHQIAQLVEQNKRLGKEITLYQQAQAIHQEKEAQWLSAQADYQTIHGFLAKMSHEMRTPMNEISGLSSLALRCEISPKVRDYLTQMAQASSTLLQINNDVLDFFKIGSGTFDLQGASLHQANQLVMLFGSQAALHRPAEVAVVNEELAASMKIGGARVLLVEDNKINQIVAADLLKRIGVTVEIAGNGQEALQRLESGSFDAVLMDVNMPVMDGHAATLTIRANPKWNSLPIIAMTAHVQEKARLESLAAGMNDHITKPIDITRLYATLVKWINPDGARPGFGRLADERKKTVTDKSVLSSKSPELKQPEASHAANPMEMDHDLIAPILKELSTMLHMRDTDAELTLDTLKNMMRRKNWPNEMQRLEERMQRMDYSGALQFLKKIQSTMTPPGERGSP